MSNDETPDNTKVVCETNKDDMMKRLLGEKKLVLIVDLDRTIVHTTTSKPPDDAMNIYLNYTDKGRPFYTRARRYTNKFLRELSKYYELHLWSFGGKSYVNKVVSSLDPDKNFFADRVLARQDFLDTEYKSDNLDIFFPAGSDMICMIDDRDDLWPNCPNLITVKEYTYYVEKKCKTHQSAGNEDDIEYDVVKFDSDEYLLHLMRLLIKIHAEFYNDSNEFTEPLQTRSLKKIIPKLRSQVLNGLSLTFTGVVKPGTDLQRSFAYKVATSLGAIVTPEINPETTHLVSTQLGTSKVKLAQRSDRKIHLVHLDWLWSCAEMWDQVDEAFYPVTWMDNINKINKRLKRFALDSLSCTKNNRVYNHES